MYAGLWSKYRPVILKMMISTEAAPQRYQLSQHEFKAFNNGKNTTFSFQFEVSSGSIVSGVKDSLIAQDLLEVLRMSPKASELISSGSYRFSMDKQFVLNVEKNINVN